MATKRTSKTDAVPAKVEPAAAAPETKRRSVTPHRTARTKKTVVEANTVASPETLDAEIAAVAYQLWVESGHVHGNDAEHWARAEEKVRTGRGA